MTRLLTGGTILIGFLVFLVFGASWYAFVAVYLWDWFIVPIFNAPHLTVLQMWGICLTLNVIRPYSQQPPPKDDEHWIVGLSGPLGGMIVGPLAALGMGYAIKFWLMGE